MDAAFIEWQHLTWLDNRDSCPVAKLVPADYTNDHGHVVLADLARCVTICRDHSVHATIRAMPTSTPGAILAEI